MRCATTVASSRSPRCFGKTVPSTGLADGVAGPTDALQAAADGARRLDLDHEVDRAHVDAELEAGGGDEAAQLAPLQLVLDDDPLLAGQRAVVGLHQLAATPASTPSVSASSLRRAARRSARRRALQKMIVERWASTCCEDAGVDATARCSCGPGRPPAGPLRGSCEHLAEVAHVLDGDDDLDLERLADAGVDDRDRAGPARRLEPAEEAGDLLQRALRGRQPDALRRPLAQRVEPLEARA